MIHSTSTRQGRRGLRACLAVAVAAAIALAGCTASGEPNDDGGSTEVTDEVIAQAKARSEPWIVTSSGPGVVQDGKSLDFTIIKIATVRAAEELKEQGWNVEARFIEANENVIQSAVQNESDAINVALPSVLPAVAGGVPLQVFAGGSRFGFVVVGESSIKGPEDLEGKRVAYQAPISSGTLAVRLFALDTDVSPQYLVMAGSAARAEALLAGQLDVVAVSPGFDQEIIEQGEPGQFATLYKPLDDYPDLLDTVLAYNGELSLERRAFLQALLTEQIKAVRELTANPGVLEEWMAEHEVTVTPPVDVLIGLLFDDIGVSAETVDQQVELMTETEQIDAGSANLPSGSQLIDTSIWDAIKGDLG